MHKEIHKILASLQWSFWLLSALFFTVFLAACTQGEFRRECDTNADCPTNQVCLFSNCIVEKEGDAPDVGIDTDGDTEEDPADCVPAEETCDGVDNDCDGLVDAADPDFTLPLCDKQDGVCKGAEQFCVNGALVPCDDDTYAAHAAAQNNTYEPNSETLCDNQDNNCNATTDEDDPTWVPIFCDNQDGVCQGSTNRCINGQNTGCDEAAFAAHSPLYSSGDELMCDGEDNNCNTQVDELCCTQTNDTYNTVLPSELGERLNTLKVKYNEATGRYGFVGRGGRDVYTGIFDENGTIISIGRIFSDPGEERDNHAIAITDNGTSFFAFFGSSPTELRYAETHMVVFSISGTFSPDLVNLNLSKNPNSYWGGLEAIHIPNTNEIFLATTNFDDDLPGGDLLSFYILDVQNGSILREMHPPFPRATLAAISGIEYRYDRPWVFLNTLGPDFDERDDHIVWSTGNIAVDLDFELYYEGLYEANFEEDEDEELNLGFQAIEIGEFNRGFYAGRNADGENVLFMSIMDTTGRFIGEPIIIRPLTYQTAQIVGGTFLYASHVSDDGMIHLTFAFNYEQLSGVSEDIQTLLYSFYLDEEGQPREIDESVIIEENVSVLLCGLYDHPRGFLSVIGLDNPETGSVSVGLFNDAGDALCY